jgi:GntR family transcriptional regulator, transcriptional repressor for pyruvate dehydrogenase complex
MEEITRETSGSRTEWVYHAIIKMVRDGEYRAGDKLPNERALADHFQIGRTTLRQAMARIQKQGLVVRRVGSGTYIADNAALIIENQYAQEDTHHDGPYNLDSILEARLLFEPGAVNMAATNATDNDLRNMAQCLDNLLTVESWLEYKEAIYAATLSIYQGTGNDFLIHIFEQIIRHRRSVNYDGRGTDSKVSGLVKKQAHSELKTIVDAVMERDGQKAESLSQDYILRIFASVNL